MWSTIALRGGDENSNARLEGLASRMTRAQVAAATQQAETWISQHNYCKLRKELKQRSDIARSSPPFSVCPRGKEVALSKFQTAVE